MSCDQIQAELQENLRYWLQFPPLTADQWKIAELPVTSGGLAFPSLHRQAVVARISCLATLPEFLATQDCRQDVIEKERLEQRLGCDAPGAGRQCARPGWRVLDAFGLHAASCNWGQVCKRHDKLRDLLAHAARQAGMAAVSEQNMTTEADTTGAVCGIHRADVREPMCADGRESHIHQTQGCH